MNKSPMPQSKKYYILMADIVDSRMQKGKILMENFKSLTIQVTAQHKRSLLSPITITLGDEFQTIIKSFKDALAIIFSFEELIIHQGFGFKLRYVLHYGEIDTEINSKIAYEMLGKGLTDARKFLSILKKDDKRILIELVNQKSTIYNDAYFLYTSIIDRWKTKDNKLLSSFIKLEDYKKVADSLNMDRSGVWRKAKTLQIKQYLSIKHLIVSLSKI